MVRSWSHAFKLKNSARKKEKKKKRMAIAKRFALHATVTIKIYKRIMTRREYKRKLKGSNTILFINEYKDFLWKFLR